MIPTKPPPNLKEPEKFSNEFSDFISRCLVKSPEERPSATALLQHRFIRSARSVSVLKDLVQYSMKIVEEEEGEDSGSDVSSNWSPFRQPCDMEGCLYRRRWRRKTSSSQHTTL